MKVEIKILISIIIISWLTGCSFKSQRQYQDNTNEFHRDFMESFNDSSSNYFRYGSSGKGADFTWEIGADSPTEPGTKILSFKIDPDEVAGAGKGPEVISNKLTYYGTYSARLKVPDARKIQPNVGAVVGYFTYRVDNEHGLSEIDYEWLIADPEIIYVGTWTGSRGNLKRIGRTINMAEGIIYETSSREQDGSNRRTLTGKQSQPESIEPIGKFDASLKFYTYGFDWYPNRIRWWMIHPTTFETIVLWDYEGSDVGIPTSSTYYRMNFWHTNNWAVETNPNSLEKPIYPFELEVDWMSYKPMDLPKM